MRAVFLKEVLAFLVNYFFTNARWKKMSSFLTCWGESSEDPQLYEGIHVFSRTKSLIQMARIFHMHQFCFRWCGFFKHTTFLSYGVDFSLARDFLYMARTFHMHQISFTWHRLFTCTNFAFTCTNYVFTFTRFPLDDPVFSRFQTFLEMALT
jgi:hypothetical protein